MNRPTEVGILAWAVRFVKPGETLAGPPEDPTLTAALMAEAPGILAWIVRGAVDYTSAGSLHPFPASVVRETAAYRAEEDPWAGSCWIASRRRRTMRCC